MFSFCNFNTSIQNPGKKDGLKKFEMLYSQSNLRFPIPHPQKATTRPRDPHQELRRCPSREQRPPSAPDLRRFDPDFRARTVNIPDGGHAGKKKNPNQQEWRELDANEKDLHETEHSIIYIISPYANVSYVMLISI